MIEYELDISFEVTADNQIKVRAQFLRSVDGGDFEPTSLFEQVVKPAIADSAILAAVTRRFESYCRVDSDRIAKVELQERCDALESALDGARFIP